MPAWFSCATPTITCCVAAGARSASRARSRAAAIASVSSIGYSGFLIGPPLIGFIAQSVSLTAAMSVVVIGTVLLALGARRVPVQD